MFLDVLSFFHNMDFIVAVGAVMVEIISFDNETSFRLSKLQRRETTLLVI